MMTVMASRKRVKKRKPVRVPPGLPEVERLWTAACDLSGAGLIPLSSATFVHIAAWSGLRLHENAALLARDVHEGPGGDVRVFVADGKGGKARTSVLLRPGVVVAWIRNHPVGPDERVCSRRCGGSWSRQRWNEAWQRIVEEAGLPAGTRFHDLRKFHASYLLNAGVSEMDVAFQLGHIRADGRPDVEQVRRTYGYPDAALALDRVVEAVGSC